MRTLERNKTVLWLVNVTGSSQKVDSQNYYTGEVVETFGTPTKIEIALYPSFGDIVERIFGTDTSFDMIAVSNDIVLNENSLLFETQPTSDFYKNYDYRVKRILKSLNTYNYGLESRI